MKNIVGTWALVKAVAITADGTRSLTPFGGEKAMGRVVLGYEGRMMAVLCDGRREIPGAAAREYGSYCGNYTFDGKQLITSVDAASDPTRIGTD